MKRLAIFVATFTVVACFGTPAWSQGKGGGGAGAGGFGRGGFGGAPTTRGGEGKGTYGKEAGSRTQAPSKGEQTQAPAKGEQSKGSPTTTQGKKTASELLTQNAKLSSKLESLLPPGTNVHEAAQGYENLGQLVAAAHVSKNLGIPFSDLKTEMMSGKSLGQAIHELKPGANAHQEAVKANEQALKDMEESFGRHKSGAATGKGPK